MENCQTCYTCKVNKLYWKFDIVFEILNVMKI